jgi:hypothetical protein
MSQHVHLEGHVPTAPIGVEHPSIAQLITRGASDLERLRGGWLAAYLFAWASALAAAFAAWMYLTFPDEPRWGAVWMCATATAVVAAIGSSRRRVRLGALFDAWRSEIIGAFDPTATFSADACIDPDEFDATGLNHSSYNRYRGSSYLVTGGVRMSNLWVDHVRTYMEKDENGNEVEREEVTPVFHGLMLAVAAPLPCQGTIVLNRKGGGIGRLRAFAVASPDLNKHYAMAADDPFAGHRVLTPGLQEAVWRFRGRFRNVPRLAYTQGLLYALVPGFFAEFGERPGRWRPVTTRKLRRVAEACVSAVVFAQTATRELVPDVL